MKTYLYYFTTLVSIVLISMGCEKEMMDYEGEDALYFDVRYSMDAHQFFTAVPFGSTLEDTMHIECQVMASGYPRNYDREFTVIANPDSTTAVNERDYRGLQNTYVIKAGECRTTIRFIAIRSAEMAEDTLVLQLKLQGGKHFKLLYTKYEDGPNNFSPIYNDKFSRNHDAAFHNIYLYDVMTQPKGWWKGLWGEFSATKWRLMMHLTETTFDDYSSILTTMPMARANTINDEVGKYLLEMAKSRETVVLDEDGTMMYVKAVQTLGGSSGWGAGTLPDDYFY